MGKIIIEIINFILRSRDTEEFDTRKNYQYLMRGRYGRSNKRICF